MRTFNAIRSHYNMGFIHRDARCGHEALKKQFEELLLRLHPDKQGIYEQKASIEHFLETTNAWAKYKQAVEDRGNPTSSPERTEEDHTGSATEPPTSQEELMTTDMSKIRALNVLLTWHSSRFQTDVDDIWREFCEFRDRIIQQYGISKWSNCIETHVDKDIFDSELFVPTMAERVHLHAFFEFSQRHNLGVEAFCFKGSTPHVAEQRSRGKQWQWSAERQHFYVAGMNKVGSIHRATNMIPWTHYTPYATWIDAAWRKHKINNTEFTRLSCLLREGCSKRERDMSSANRFEKKQVLQRACDLAEGVLCGRRREFRKFDVVDRFLEQFNADEERYKILIIRAPSQSGKSIFARCLLQPCFVQLVVGELEPDLREFCIHKHRSIVLDNVNNTNFIMEHRGWLQSRNMVVKFARSATDCYCYDMYLWKVPIIITMDTDATFTMTNWIRHNSFLLDVEEKLWCA